MAARTENRDNCNNLNPRDIQMAISFGLMTPLDKAIKERSERASCDLGISVVSMTTEKDGRIYGFLAIYIYIYYFPVNGKGAYVHTSSISLPNSIYT